MPSDTVYNEWPDERLLEEYASIVEFRAIESQLGRVSPGEMRQKRAVKEEILRRIGDD